MEDIEVRINNILCNEEETIQCPNCSALNPVIVITKHYLNSSTAVEHIYNRNIFRTVICSVCKHEWIPSQDTIERANAYVKQNKRHKSIKNNR